MVRRAPPWAEEIMVPLSMGVGNTVLIYFILLTLGVSFNGSDAGYPFLVDTNIILAICIFHILSNCRLHTLHNNKFHILHSFARHHIFSIVCDQA